MAHCNRVDASQLEQPATIAEVPFTPPKRLTFITMAVPPSACHCFNTWPFIKYLSSSFLNISGGINFYGYVKSSLIRGLTLRTTVIWPEFFQSHHQEAEAV